MNPRLLTVLLAACTTFAACPPPPGDIVTCKQEWSCEAGVVASKDPADPTLENTEGLVFCTDPDDPDRNVDIETYEEDFHDTCDGVPVNCIEGGVALCAAACVPGGGACDEPVKQRVKLD